MHNSYYFLKQVAAELNVRLKGFTLVSCFSQSRDELLVEFNNAAGSLFIRASLLPELQSLSFPRQLSRARKNSVDLFDDLLMKKVSVVRVIANDRSLTIELGEGHALLFKMHGNQSNVIHLKADKAIDVFRKSITQDLDITPSTLERDLDWTEAGFLNAKDMQRHFFTFGREVWMYLDERGFKDLSPPRQWEMLHNLRDILESPDRYYHAEFRSKLMFTLFPLGTTVATFKDPLEAATSFVSVYSSGHAFYMERGGLIGQLESAIRKTQQYLTRIDAHLNDLLGDKHFQVWADLLMANLKKVKEGEHMVTLENFYEDNRPIDIRLNPQLSPQKNAEVYYRKAKNRAIELSRLEQLITERRELLSKLESQLATIKGAGDLKELRALSPTVRNERSRAQAVKVPYRELVFKDFRIWIGKDASSNDELTFKYGFKEDLWLHARDVSGSHVLIKHQAGKNFPKDVIERAAQLAAFFSRRKGESLCPVSVTEKKYVRKRKGDPAGMVIVEKEKVMMVEPKGL